MAADSSAENKIEGTTQDPDVVGPNTVPLGPSTERLDDAPPSRPPNTMPMAELAARGSAPPAKPSATLRPPSGVPPAPAPSGAPQPTDPAITKDTHVAEPARIQSEPSTAAGTPRQTLDLESSRHAKADDMARASASTEAANERRSSKVAVAPQASSPDVVTQPNVAPVVARSSPPLAPPPATAPVVESLEALPLAAYELLAQSARLADLTSVTSRVVTEAARARTADWFFTSKVASIAEELRLRREDADTRFGNALDVLGSGGESPSERALAAALWAHAVAEAPRKRSEDEDSLAADILWLATHTAFDATTLLDRALGDDAGDLWAAIADRVRRIARGKGGALGRGEAVVGSAALAASTSARAIALSAELGREVKDPVLVRVLSTAAPPAVAELRIEGEMLPTPRGPVATTLLAFTGILFATHAARLFARFALAYKRPTEISLSESGVRIKTRTEMLGRTLREREHVILRAGLVRVAREVRFPRAAFYAGLLALAFGSYVGVRTFVDGVRAASPSLLLVGILIVAVGVGADFALGTLIPGARGRCRLTFVPRTGRTIAVGNIDALRADDALARSLGRR